MNTRRLLFLFVLFGVLSACHIHQGNFSKRKFLDLKKIESNEEVLIIDNAHESFQATIPTTTIEKIGEERIDESDEQSKNDNETSTEISNGEVESNQKEKIRKNERFAPKSRAEIIVQSNRAEEKIAAGKKMSTLLLFKRASLFFILGLALILWGITGLYRPFLSEAGAFVSFLLGLMALLVSAIFATKGMTRRSTEGNSTKGLRKEFVLFFGVFFIALSLLIVHGKI